MSPIDISLRQFRRLVAEALDGLPAVWAERLDNVAVVVEDEPSEEELADVGMGPDDDDELLGLYQGVPLSERGVEYGWLPDRVAIYRGPICRLCDTPDEVVQAVRETVLHELGHHFGLGEDDMPY